MFEHFNWHELLSESLKDDGGWYHLEDAQVPDRYSSLPQGPSFHVLVKTAPHHIKFILNFMITY